MIFLYGPPGSGKTAAGRVLAESIHVDFLDLDERIADRAGMAVSRIFAAEGEPGFRAREREALAEALESAAGVVSLGGGALLDPDSRRRVEASGPVFCLLAPAELLFSRIQASGEARPLLGEEGLSGLERLLQSRLSHYHSFPERLDTGGRTPEEVAWEIQVRIGRFHVHGMGAGYDVLIQPGILDRLGDQCRARDLAGPVGLVSDRTVGSLYGLRSEESLAGAGYRVVRADFAPGEVHKNLKTVADLWDSFLAGGLERGSTVAALGGGVVSDAAGFAAAAYMRGVDWVALPTSLLAMVDASLGGKTGIDLPQGKNLVGCFHPPRLVLADPLSLQSLPEPEIRAGMAEVVKHGVIGDEALFRLLEGGMPATAEALQPVIRRAAAVKVKLVQHDPFEAGARAALNFGHTIGHALEAASGFRLRHGEAVAIGMVLETRLGERLGLSEAGLADRIEAVLRGLGLPTEIPGELEGVNLAGRMRVDKKKSGGDLRFAIPLRIGEVQTGVVVGGEALRLESARPGYRAG